MLLVVKLEEEKKWCVYMHTSPSNKKYIGITSLNPKYRWNNGKGYKTQIVFYRAIQKYGWKNFKHEILFEELSEQEAKEKEIELIAKYKTNLKRYQNPSYGYNNDDGGNSCSHLLGVPLSQDHKDKISNAPHNEAKKVDVDIFNLNGEYITTTHGIKSASVLTGIEKTNICKCLKGYIGYMGEFMFRYHDTDDVKKLNPYKKKLPPNTRKVYQYALSGEFIRMYESVNEAARQLKCDATNIANVCNGIQQTSNGFIWSYEKRLSVESKNDTRILELVVSSYLLDGTYDKTYNSIAEASSDTGANRRNITACIHGRRKLAGNRMWKIGNDSISVKPYSKKMNNGIIKTWKELGMTL